MIFPVIASSFYYPLNSTLHERYVALSISCGSAVERKGKSIIYALRTMYLACPLGYLGRYAGP